MDINFRALLVCLRLRGLCYCAGFYVDFSIGVLPFAILVC